MMLLSGAESLISLTDNADTASLSSVSLTVLVRAFMRVEEKADEFVRESKTQTDGEQETHSESLIRKTRCPPPRLPPLLLVELTH